MGSVTQMRHQLLAVATVLLGIVTGVLVNLITAGWGWGLAAGLGAAALLWAAVEWKRASTPPPATPNVVVKARRRGIIRNSGATIRNGHDVSIRKIATNGGQLIDSPATIDGSGTVEQKVGKDSTIANSEIRID